MSSLQSHHKPIMTHDLAPNFLKNQLSVSSVKQQTAALQNTSFCSHYMITYESCFTGKVNTYSCERTVKEYVHGLCTTHVENWTSNCTQLYFVESIRKNFVLTDGTGSYCNEGLHSLFTSCSAWFKICFLGFIMIKKCCGNELFYKSW